MLDETSDAIMDVAGYMGTLVKCLAPPKTMETLYEETWVAPEQKDDEDATDWVRVELIRVEGYDGERAQTIFLLKSVVVASQGDSYEAKQEWLDMRCQSRAIRTAVARFERLWQTHPYYGSQLSAEALLAETPYALAAYKKEINRGVNT